MLIIIDKNTKQIINNLGTNSIFSDGNIPNLQPNDNEIFIKLNDDSNFANIINTAYDYSLELDTNNNITNVVVTKTKEQYLAEQPIQQQPPTTEERLTAVENTITSLLGL